jgi:hypothetical protein
MIRSKGRGEVYRGNRHLAVWGSDFQFQHAGMWFKQMDLLLKEINTNPTKYGATIKYSTLATYFDHIHQLNQQDDPSVRCLVLIQHDLMFRWNVIGSNNV